jgi:hypothetical protein
MRLLALRPCSTFVVATTRSATPRSLAARREENALRDPAWRGVVRSHIPCGRCPQPAVRAGGAETDRRVGSRLHPSRSPGRPCSGAYPRETSGQASCARSPRRPRRDGRSPPSVPSPPHRGTVPGARSPHRQIRGLRPRPLGTVGSVLEEDLGPSCRPRGAATLGSACAVLREVSESLLFKVWGVRAESTFVARPARRWSGLGSERRAAGGILPVC